ncbi:MAG: hypothetical protein ABI432_03600 [Flavobacteriales bacterium]
MRTLLFAFVLFSANSFCQTPDPTFGADANGTVLVNTGMGDAWLYALALQPDGRIIGAGSSYDGTGSVLIMRFTSAGELDATFGVGGIATIPPAIDLADALAVAVQADGKIVVAGTNDVNGVAGGAIWRLNANGSLDEGFASGGVYSSAVPSGSGTLTGLLLQPDGKVVACGWFRSVGGLHALHVLRLTTNGTLDDTFNGTGNQTLDASATGDAYNAYALALQADGKVLVAGNVTEGGGSFVPDALCFRLTSAGAMDASFGTNGMSIPHAVSYDHVYALAVQPDGRIILGGLTTLVAERNALIVRLLADGSLDPAFGTVPGVWNVTPGPTTDSIEGIAVRNDGTYIVCGTSTPESSTTAVGFIGALNASDATPMTAFGSNGQYPVDFDYNTQVSAELLQPDGKLLVVGRSKFAADTSEALVGRYDVSVAVGIAPAAARSTIYIAPNPAHDLIAVTIPSELGTRGTLRIVDATGRTVLGTLTITPGRLSLPVVALAHGLYNVEIVLGDHYSAARFLKE